MLKHRTIAPAFCLLMLLMLLVDFKSNVSWMYYVALIVIFLGIETYGAANIRSNFHLKAFSAGNAAQRQVAITFDDGPHEHTPLLLDILKKEQVPATFFCIGKNIVGRENVLQRMNNEGHTIGNHSYSHGFLFDLLPKKKLILELEDTKALIKKTIDKTPNYFRPPYGVTTPAMAKACKKTNVFTIGWNLRSFDTSTSNQNILLNNIKSKIKPGTILLLHDHVKNADQILLETIQFLKSNNYQIVSLQELSGHPAYV